MRFDDDGDSDFDETEAWFNAIVHIGEGMIGFLFDHRAAHWPSMSDSEFLPVLDGVRTRIGELLEPERLKELWDCVCLEYEERCQAKTRSDRQNCEVVLQRCLPEWSKIISMAKPPKRQTRRSRKPKK